MIFPPSSCLAFTPVIAKIGTARTPPAEGGIRSSPCILANGQPVTEKGILGPGEKCEGFIFWLTSKGRGVICSIRKDYMMNPYEDCIVFLLAKAYQKAQGVSKQRLKAYGLTPIQHLVIEALWEEDQLTATELGNRLTLDHATVSGILDRMEAGGWIIKKTNPEDKRCLSVLLAAKARELGSTLFQERERANEEILADLTLEEKILLKRLLRTLRG